MSHEIPLALPDVSEYELAAVASVLRSGTLTGGPSLQDFEDALAGYSDCDYGVGVSSGTAALYLALRGLGVGAGGDGGVDEVIMSPFCFSACLNAVLQTGAKPVYVDIDPVTMNLNADGVERAIGENTKAIIASISFGNLSGIDRVAAVAASHELPMIENAGEALGSRCKGRPVGSFGRCAVYSFYPNRVITTGEGGMVVTNDDRLAHWVRQLRNHGRREEKFSTTLGHVTQHRELGFNFRMSEIAAALGLAQLERIDEMLRARQELASDYFDRLIDFPELILPTLDHDVTMSWFSYVVRLDRAYQAMHRDRVMSGMHRHEVGCASYFSPLHLQPCSVHHVGEFAGQYPVTESVASRTLALPFYTKLDEAHLDLVCNTLRIMLDREQIALDEEQK